MNNFFKIVLGIAAAILLYYTLHILVALVSLAVLAVAVALLVQGYKNAPGGTKKALTLIRLRG